MIIRITSKRGTTCEAIEINTDQTEKKLSTSLLAMEAIIAKQELIMAKLLLRYTSSPGKCFLDDPSDSAEVDAYEMLNWEIGKVERKEVEEWIKKHEK